MLLVVDDEETILDVTKKMLQRAGFAVLTAADGVEALEVFTSHLHEVRAVVLDLTMPRLGGEEALFGLRSIRPDVPILLTTGAANDLSSDLEALPGIALLHKPYNTAELLAAVRDLLEETAD